MTIDNKALEIALKFFKERASPYPSSIDPDNGKLFIQCYKAAEAVDQPKWGASRIADPEYVAAQKSENTRIRKELDEMKAADQPGECPGDKARKDNVGKNTPPNVIYAVLGGDKNPAAASLVASILWDLTNKGWAFVNESDIMRESSAEVHFASLTKEDFSTINAAIEISKPAAADLESLKNLQMKVLMLARLVNTEIEGDK